MSVHANQDPSRFSYYMTDAFYCEMISDFSDWQTDDRVVGDTAERDQFRSILEKEARLLDRLLFEEWLGLFVPDCAYWVPSTRNQGDPRRSGGRAVAPGREQARVRWGRRLYRQGDVSGHRSLG